jgi:hypothetical protein
MHVRLSLGTISQYLSSIRFVTVNLSNIMIQASSRALLSPLMYKARKYSKGIEADIGYFNISP